MFVQDLIGTHWQPIDTNEIVLSSAIGHAFLEELLYRLSVRNLDGVSKTAAVAVDVKYLHNVSMEGGGKPEQLKPGRSQDGGPRVVDMTIS